MKCLVADDDPLVCETVDEFLSRIEDVEFCLQAGDGLTALNLLSSTEIDVAFLDLQMPGLDGESLLRAISRDLPVIVISASTDFAARSYEFNVTDYLVKPLEFPRFYQAVQKARERLVRRTGQAAPAKTPEAPAKPPDEIFVKDGSRLLRIDLRRLLFVKAEANYVDFVMDDKSQLALVSMKKVEELLPPDFIRIHRSFIVNKNRIARIEESFAHIGTHKLPISQTYREELLKRLKVIN